MPDYVRAAELSAIPANKKLCVTVAGKSLLICNVSGAIHVVSNICSHADEKLDGSGVRIRSAGTITIHGETIDMKNDGNGGLMPSNRKQVQRIRS